MSFRDQGQSDSSKAAFDLSLRPPPRWEEEELGGSGKVLLQGERLPWAGHCWSFCVSVLRMFLLFASKEAPLPAAVLLLLKSILYSIMRFHCPPSQLFCKLHSNLG